MPENKTKTNRRGQAAFGDDELGQVRNLLFGDHAQQPLDQTMEELKEMRRQQSSSIVVPQGDPMGGMPGGPPGSKIQMP